MYRRTRIAALLLPVMLAAGCAAPSTPAPAGVTQATVPAGTLIDGFVQAGPALEGAEITLLGLDGQPVAGAVTSSAEGHFSLVLGAAPPDFRIIARGGQLAGQPFDGELSAEVRGFGASSGAQRVDLVSTLVSRYWRQHPEEPLAGAEQKVRASMGLSSAGGPARVDEAAWLAAARESGGLDALMTRMAEEIGQGSTRAFNPPSAPPDGLLQAPVALPVAQFVASNLAAGAVSAIGGYGMNQLLGLFGTSDSAQLAAINKKLDTLLAEVRQMQGRLDSLETLMRGLAANTDFQAKQRKLQEQITYINYLDREYRALAALTAGGDATKIGLKQAAIKTYMTDRFPYPNEALQIWRDELVGHGGASEGLIRMWHRVINTKYPKYYHAGIARTHFDQWAYWDAYQARLVLYLSAAIEAGAYPGVETTEFLGLWQQVRAEQLKQLRGVPADQKSDTLDLSRFGLANQVTALNAIPPEVVIDTRSKRMFADRVSLRATPAEYKLNAQKACDIPDRATGLHGWGLPTVADFKALAILDGKPVAFKDMGFTGQLDVHSYTFWTSDWTGEQQAGRVTIGSTGYYMQVWNGALREVWGGWNIAPREIHSDTWRAGIALLPVRTIPDDELNRYVYPL